MSSDVVLQRADIMSAVVDQFYNAILIVDDNGGIVFANKACSDFLGYAPDAVMGQNLDVIFPDAGQSDLLKGSHQNLNMHAIHGDLGTISVAINSNVFYHENKAFWTLTFQNMPLQKQTRQHLAQAQKMEAIGKIASVITHKFNNILNIILGNLNVLRLDMDGDFDLEEIEEVLETIETAALKGVGYTSRLTVFAREELPGLDQGKTKKVDVN